MYIIKRPVVRKKVIVLDLIVQVAGGGSSQVSERSQVTRTLAIEPRGRAFDGTPSA